VPSGTHSLARSRITPIGFSVMCSRSRGDDSSHHPGRDGSPVRIGIAPLLPHTTNSHACPGRPACDLNDPMGFAHDAMPRQHHPPACSASVVVGSCRQSVNNATKAPSRATRRHSASHSADHARYARWSRLSPTISGYSASLPTYFADDAACRSPRNAPQTPKPRPCSMRSRAW